MGKKLTALDQLKTSMARAKGWASNQVAQVAQAAAEAMEEMDGVKADKSEGVAVVIPTTGWSQDSGAYPYYYDIPAEGVTAKDRPTWPWPRPVFRLPSPAACAPPPRPWRARSGCGPLRPRRRR